MSKTFVFEPLYEKGMMALMDKYGDSKTMFGGVNELGERVTISIFKDKIVTLTFQANGWMRKNIYWRDGTVEELYEGKYM